MYIQFSSVQFICSVVSDSLQPYELQHSRPPCPSPISKVYPHPGVGDAIQPSHPLSFPSPPDLNLSQHQGLFQWVSSSHQVAKVHQLQHQSFQWVFRIDYFRIDWLDLLEVQWTLNRLHQHHSSKTSVLQCPAFFMIQVSHPYMTTGKTIAFTIWIFVRKVMSLLPNMLLTAAIKLKDTCSLEEKLWPT